MGGRGDGYRDHCDRLRTCRLGVLVAAMSVDLPKWMWRDPAYVAERLEEMARKRAFRTRDARAEEARQELEKLFKEKPGEQEQH